VSAPLTFQHLPHLVFLEDGRALAGAKRRQLSCVRAPCLEAREEVM